MNLPKARVNPESDVGVQQRLQAMADPMLAKMKGASENIGKLVESAPKSPVNMNGIKDSLGHENVIPGTPNANTINKLNGYFEVGQKARAILLLHGTK